MSHENQLKHDRGKKYIISGLGHAKDYAPNGIIVTSNICFFLFLADRLVKDMQNCI